MAVQARTGVGRAAILWLSLAVLPAAGPPEKGLDRQSLEQIEDQSESLANALLDFSVALRDRNLERVPLFFAERVRMTPFPLQSLPPQEHSRWVERASRDLSGLPLKSWTRSQVAERWARLLGSFSALEDVRVKVEDAEFEGPAGKLRAKSRFRLFLVGRDGAGRRRWLRGRGHLGALQSSDPPWRIHEFALEELKDWSAGRDLFSEVSLPAGVAISLPPVGTPGNDNFFYHGAGAGDVNGDGLLDLLVTGHRATYLYLNQGDGTFREGAAAALIPPSSNATAPLLVDYDNDGDLDIFLARVGSQMLLENRLHPDGRLEFVDASLQSGVARQAIGFGATAADVNGDGWPDIYVSSYNLYGRIMPNSWSRASNGTPNLLFLNQGDGTFRESAAAWGVRDRRWSYAAQFADVDGDGRLDLYVANDFGENALYLNRGDHFEEAARRLGVLDPGNGMGVSFGDFNNDGALDLLVTNMSSTAGNRILNRLFPGNSAGAGLRKLAAGSTLFQGGPRGSFRDVSRHLGPFASGWAWGGVFFDFDNDGWQDLYSPNGFISGKSMKDT